MRSRGVLGVTLCTLGDCLSGGGGQSGTAEYPWSIGHWMTGFNLPRLRRQSQRLGRDVEEASSLAEVQPRLEPVSGRLVHWDTGVGAECSDARAWPTIAVAGRQA